MTDRHNNISARPLTNMVGNIILEELEAKGMKQSELCDLTGIAKPILNDVVKGRRNITAEMAVLIESALGLSADKILMAQMQYELDKAYNDNNIIDQVRCMSDWSVMSEHLSEPILKKLGIYDKSVKRKVEKAMNMLHISSIEEFNKISHNEQGQAYYKKSDKLIVDKKALFTWKYYCIDVASKIQLQKSFDKGRIGMLNEEIKKITAENEDTYERVKVAFENIGIRLLYIEKEGQIPVDGMSFWFGKNPTVVITRRLPNIDNFAFSVMHELGHVKFHLHKNDGALINLDGQELNREETEANEYARDSFIPKEEWEKFTRSVKDISPYAVHIPIAQKAAELHVNPQILYGRYMHDTGLYRLRRVFTTSIN